MHTQYISSNKKATQDQLLLMGFQANYISRAFKVYEKNYGQNYNVDVIAEIINRLQNKDNANKNQKISVHNNNNNHNKNVNSNIDIPFQSHMTFEEANKLKINDKLDHRDCAGRFVLATVLEKQGTKLKIHYDGWSKKWDEWSDYSSQLTRFAIAESISKRPAHRFTNLAIGNYVSLNPTQRHVGWKCGEIRRLDPECGQVQVAYEGKDKNYIYWAHLDDPLEIAEFTTKSLPLQNEPQGKKRKLNHCTNTSNSNAPNSIPRKRRKLNHCSNPSNANQNQLITNSVNNLFKIGNQIDCRDTKGEWYYAEIKKYKSKMDIIPENELEKLGEKQRQQIGKLNKLEGIYIHYIDYDEKYSQWLFVEERSFCNCDKENKGERCWNMSHRLSAPKTQSIYKNRKTKSVIDDEYSGVRVAFFSTLSPSDYEITEIKDISNKDKIKIYESILDAKCNAANVKPSQMEQFLWHGIKGENCNDVLNKILKNGFDRSYNKVAKYGKGNYFALSSEYSVKNNYCGKDINNEYFILFCRVFIGSFTKGKKDMKTIPTKENGEEYDSLVDNIDNPKIFVSWRDFYAIPYYLVKFKRFV